MAWTNTAAAKGKIKAAHITELQTAVDAVGGARRGTSTTNGATGRAITFSTAMADSSYSVAITFTENPGPNVGAVWIGSKTSSGFTVYNVGDAGKAFEYLAVKGT